jgi:alpha-galactosidase
MTTLTAIDGAIDAADTGRSGAPAVGVHRLLAGGVEVVVSATGAGLPEVLHWGAPLGDVETGALQLAMQRGVSSSGLDRPWPQTILPGEPDGWEGRAGLAGHRGGATLLPRWGDTQWSGDQRVLRVTASAAGLLLTTKFHLDDAGVLRIDHNVVNTGGTAVDITALEATLPVGDVAREVLDFSGRWTRERSPQRTVLTEGSRVRESRRGRTGHDSSFLLAVGTPGFTDSVGEIWATHLAWSGDSIYRVDALPEARTLIGAGPLLRAGEITLEPGETFRSPTAVFVWSDAGLDQISHRLHSSLRSRPGHPHRLRPVTLNTWEAVYFQHDFGRLERLAEVASAVGVERFVLDDGWFRARRSDTAGLGDWTVDRQVWPDGLHPLLHAVAQHGMEFGLWFEPEMVSLDSDLARQHPDWLLGPDDGEVRSWRNQYVLDVSNPLVFDYLFDSISTLVTEYRLSYLKWDQNRDLIEAVSEGRAHVHRHTEAVYELLDALRRQHPGLEIEACASGGARVDLGILERTDRVWASDTNDPIERLEIQRWTGLILPPELIGAHVGPPVAHTTRRASDLGFRIAVALFASAGIEWDITACTPEELDELRDAFVAYKRLRAVLHTGRTAQIDNGDPGLRITSVIATDGGTAVVRVARVATGGRALPAMLRIPGLIPAALYELKPVPELRAPRILDVTPPAWLEQGSVRLPGSTLANLGVRLPQLGPGQALVFEAVVC